MTRPPHERATARLGAIRRVAAAHGAPAALVTHLPAIRWAVGFSGSNGALLVTPTRAHLVTDGRYREQAAAEVAVAEVHVPGYRLFEHMAEQGLLEGAAPLVVQADALTVAQYVHLERTFEGTPLVAVTELLAVAIAQRDAALVAQIAEAQARTARVLEDVLALVRPGVTERELAAEIVYRHLRAGASAMAFEPIVASGPNGARPHARPTDRRLAAGDLVVLDMGGVFEGVCADLTRTVALGEPGAAARRAYEAVREAKAAAIAAVRAGVSGAFLERTARDVLARYGLEAHFAHSLGHGVGYEIHEWPRLSQQVDHVLPGGATVTIEPGVYLEGRFGIRIEDVVVAEAGGARNLTPLSDALIVL
ncbi:MAG: M24 family metallopeptidase [Rubricoccaceae bacterium]